MFKNLKFTFCFLSLFLTFCFGLSIFSFHFLPYKHGTNLRIQTLEKSDLSKEELAAKNSFKNEILMTLKFLAEYHKYYKDRSELTINNKKYSVTELIKPNNIKKTYTDMSSKAQKQLDDLLEGGIDNRKMILNSNYKKKLLNTFLNGINNEDIVRFTKNNINKIIINNKTYQIGNLKIPVNKGFSNLTKEAQKVLIELFVDQIDRNKLYDARLESLLNTIKPALQLFAITNVTDIEIENNHLHPFKNLINNLDTPISEMNQETKADLKLLEWISSVISDNNDKKLYDELISVYTDKIELFFTSIKPVLEVFKVWNQNEISVSSKEYQIGHLINNLDKQSQKELPENAWNELYNLFFNKINQQKLITTPSYKSKLSSFFEIIKPILQSFLENEIIFVVLNKEHYRIDALTANLDKKISAQPNKSLIEMMSLFNYDISFKTIVQDLNDNLMDYKTSLDEYKNLIQPILEKFANAKIKNIEIDGITHPIDLLFKKNNLKLTGSQLPQAARKQMINLLHRNIYTKTQLDIVLTTILETREAKAKAKVLQTQKKSEQKKLIIGLSVGGGVLFLSSLGGFLYWFLKVKK